VECAVCKLSSLSEKIHYPLTPPSLYLLIFPSSALSSPPSLRNLHNNTRSNSLDLDQESVPTPHTEIMATINGPLQSIIPPHVQLRNASNMVNGFAMGTHHMRQRLILPRSVNSFMAFRCKHLDVINLSFATNNYIAYYSRIFAKMQQKNTSPHIKMMWDEEIFKGKWVLVAKAYTTIIRAVGKSAAPLDGFLDLVGPEIGLIAVDEYLETMNWEVRTNDDGTISLKQTSPVCLSSFDEQMLWTLMSEEDIIDFVRANDYIGQNVLTGPNNQLPQQGLFAAAMGFPQLLQFLPALPVQQPEEPRQLVPAQQFQLEQLQQLHEQVRYQKSLEAQQALQAQQPVPAERAQPAQHPQQAPPPLPHFATQYQFLQSVATDTFATASMVLGLDVKNMMRATLTKPVAWTGSMADVYDQGSGSFNTNRASHERWAVGTIHDPQGFDNIFADSIEDGHLIPTGKYSHSY
jgi:hypothetical protein